MSKPDRDNEARDQHHKSMTRAKTVPLTVEAHPMLQRLGVTQAELDRLRDALEGYIS